MILCLSGAAFLTQGPVRKVFLSSWWVTRPYYHYTTDRKHCGSFRLAVDATKASKWISKVPLDLFYEISITGLQNFE